MRQQVHSGSPFTHLVETLKILDNLVTYILSRRHAQMLSVGGLSYATLTNKHMSFDMVFYKFFHSYLGKL